jgi:predicted 2-oxoglutarate/Fe(II)-dependent dioxygenase YbiX
MSGRGLRFWLLFAHLQHALSFGSLFGRLFNRTACPEDRDKNCQVWASEGECESNPAFMEETCARACGRCEGVPKVKQSKSSQSRKAGCNDEDDYGCSKRAAAGGCDSDKGEMLYRCPASCKVCGYHSLLQEALGCDDTSNTCAEWARHGECQANPAFMLESCAVSCKACETKRKSCNRPANTPPVVGKNDINETMTRILRDFPQYSPKAISWPGHATYGKVAPWVMTLSNFINDEEAEAFTSTCEQHFARSLAGDQLSPVRTSYQCWCSGNECERHPLTRLVADRISNVTRAPVRYMEPFQILKYEPGQFYRAHHDQNSGLFTPQGVRVYTFFMYLSTPDAGGGTKFNNLDVVVPAVKGSAVLWPSVTNLDPSRDEPKTMHEALPVEAGRKFAANVWIHNFDYRTPSQANCLLTHKNTH